MGTSTSYIPKVTRETTKTKRAITNYVNSAKKDGINAILKSFGDVIGSSTYGLLTKGIITALEKLADAIISITGNGASQYINDNSLEENEKVIYTPQDLFNLIIKKEGYLKEIEKSILLISIEETINDLKIDDLENIESMNYNQFFLTFLVNLINSFFKCYYFEHIENKTKDPSETKKICKDIKDYLVEKVINDKKIPLDLLNNKNKLNKYIFDTIKKIIELL